jgi:hypothetical protein
LGVGFGHTSGPAAAAAGDAVAGGVKEEAAGVAEQVVPVGLKLCGSLRLLVGSHSLILPILATPLLSLSGELVAMGFALGVETRYKGRGIYIRGLTDPTRCIFAGESW